MADARGALESAAHFTRGGSTPAPDHDATHSDRTERVATEQTRLVQWARENGKLGKRLPPELTRGGEHRVYFHKRLQRYFKSNLLERQLGYGISLGSYSRGATPSEYLDRLSLQNSIFNDDIRLERIVLIGTKPVVVTSQPFIRGTSPEQSTLDEMMIEKGYVRLAEGAYCLESRGLLIFDLFPRNAIQTATGVIFPIDPVIQRIAPDFLEFLRMDPNCINRH